LAGIALVILQFALLAVLGSQVAIHATKFAPIYALVLMLGGILLGLWSVSVNRPGNFNIRPMPKAGGKMIEQGPYRLIRHPMYLSLMLAGLGAALAAMSVVAWISWAGLVLVLNAKAAMEERALRQQFPHYQDYCARSWRFLPGIF
jgi:protein-S-isoprenylcysteine O-methyltransferase Ste14